MTTDTRSSHPGHVASSCPIRGTVTPRYGAAVGAGYNCLHTGGHCLPGNRCESYRRAFLIEQEHQRQFDKIYNQLP